MSRTIPQLTALAITLRLSPPPQNLSESRAILRVMQKFGQVTAFKALRYQASLSEFLPVAHVLFTSAAAVKAVREQAPLVVGRTQVRVVEDFGKWGGTEHLEYLERAGTIVGQEDGGMEMVMATRASGGGFGILGRRDEHVAGKVWKGIGGVVKPEEKKGV